MIAWLLPARFATAFMLGQPCVAACGRAPGMAPGLLVVTVRMGGQQVADDRAAAWRQRERAGCRDGGCARGRSQCGWGRSRRGDRPLCPRRGFRPGHGRADDVTVGPAQTLGGLLAGATRHWGMDWPPVMHEGEGAAAHGPLAD